MSCTSITSFLRERFEARDDRVDGPAAAAADEVWLVALYGASRGCSVPSDMLISSMTTLLQERVAAKDADWYDMCDCHGASHNCSRSSIDVDECRAEVVAEGCSCPAALIRCRDGRCQWLGVTPAD